MFSFVIHILKVLRIILPVSGFSYLSKKSDIICDPRSLRHTHWYKETRLSINVCARISWNINKKDTIRHKWASHVQRLLARIHIFKVIIAYKIPSGCRRWGSAAWLKLPVLYFFPVKIKSARESPFWPFFRFFSRVEFWLSRPLFWKFSRVVRFFHGHYLINFHG